MVCSGDEGEMAGTVLETGEGGRGGSDAEESDPLLERSDAEECDSFLERVDDVVGLGWGRVGVGGEPDEAKVLLPKV